MYDVLSLRTSSFQPVNTALFIIIIINLNCAETKHKKLINFFISKKRWEIEDMAIHQYWAPFISTISALETHPTKFTMIDYKSKRAGKSTITIRIGGKHRK